MAKTSTSNDWIGISFSPDVTMDTNDVYYGNGFDFYSINFKVEFKRSNFKFWQNSILIRNKRALKEDNSIIALSHYADGPKETISTAQTGIIPGTIETFRNGTHFSIGFQRELSVTKARFLENALQ